MAKRNKNRRKRRRRLIGFMTFILILLIGVAAYIFLSDRGAIGGSKEEGEVSMNLGNNLEIIDFGPYSGPFVEDGTDEEVTDVLMLVIRNNGKETLKCANLSMKYGDEKAKFDLSTLLPGEEMIVLEKNRVLYSAEAKMSKMELKNREFFEEKLNLYEDDFQIIQSDGELEIENVSGIEAGGPVVIYYKNLSGNRYLGGITYSVVVEDGIEPTEIVQQAAEHFTLDNSELMYMTIGE